MLVAKMIFVAHMLGCGWFYMTSFAGTGERNWFSEREELVEFSGTDAGVGEQYLISIYWVCGPKARCCCAPARLLVQANLSYPLHHFAALELRIDLTFGRVS